MRPAVHVEEAVREPEVDAVRALFVEYAGTLPFDLDYQGFDNEISAFPGKYAPPGGVLQLAHVDDMPAGAIGLRPLAPDVAEVKRLYVRPTYQGLGIGRLLVERVIESGRRIGYRKLRLDTIRDLMAPAEALYRSVGFNEIPPYYENPIPNAVYYELKLT